jgi:hypothetical protein
MSVMGLARGLGIRSGSKVWVLNPPNGFVQRLNPLPDGVEFLVSAKTGLDVILFFTKDAYELVGKLPELARSMALTGGLWICFPQPAKPPLSEAFVRQAGLEFGLVDDRRWFLGEGWSGLRLVWRQRPRPEKPSRQTDSHSAQA